ncbi:IS3 family transposase [uncultured Duncaniella sp.]|uniref:IS3 family transposase n=1 Tax=uncultured Duncaniella sp. TaxID=2768039 RepID=UPI00261C80A7|nr:IS3 family transposase [uncultured Duncaniella sp.]
MEEKYRCVRALSRDSSVELVCRELEVSRSGYYAWLKHKPSVREQSNRALKRRLIELHEKYPALGLDSLYRLLKPEFGCSRKRVHRQMRLSGIYSARRRAYKATTNSAHSLAVAPNLLKRNFNFDCPNQAWVGDITYIPTAEGWLYLAIVKDLWTRKIIGYSFSDRIDTQLSINAIDMACRRQKPPKGLIFHSDRGVQYAAEAFRECLEAYSIRQSMSRKGDPYDNAVAENFFSCLKCELCHLKQYHSRSAAKNDIFAYIEAFYNSIRPHSALGWVSPNRFEADFYSRSAA